MLRFLYTCFNSFLVTLVACGNASNDAKKPVMLPEVKAPIIESVSVVTDTAVENNRVDVVKVSDDVVVKSSSKDIEAKSSVIKSAKTTKVATEKPVSVI